MSQEPFWKQLADTRHRVQMTKLHLRTDAAQAAAAGTAEEAKFSVSVDYPDGSKALRFDDGGTGFVYYPSGNVAVCVSKFSPYQKKFFLYGDDTKGTLIGFSSEKSEGFALSADRKVLWNLDGGSIVGADGSVQRRWRWDPTKQNAGSPPSDPVTIYLNDALQCTFLSRQECSFKFAGNGVVREFDCSEKLRRYDSYLDNSARGATGRVEVNVASPVTLQQRLAQKLEAGKLQRARLNPRSDMIANPEMSGVMKSLEEHFFPYEQKVKNDKSSGPKLDPAAADAAPDSHFYTSTSIGGEWRADADGMTAGEVGRIKSMVARKAAAAAVEAEGGGGGGGGGGGAISAGGGGAEEDSFYWQKKNGKLMNNIEVLEALLKQNPVLPQPAAVAQASGRYLAGSAPPQKKPKMCKLRELSHRNFDDVVQGAAKNPNQLVFVAAMRAEIGACRQAQLLLELANGELYAQAAAAATAGTGAGARLVAAGGDGTAGISGGGGVDAGGAGGAGAEATPRREAQPDMIMCRFDMAGSRLLMDRYGVQSVPTYLMFHGGRLVYGGSLGGAPITLETGREPPHVLLVEPATRDQLIIEKIMKAQGVRCDLALSVADVQHHVALQRSAGLGKGKRKYHGVVILGDGLSDSDVASVLSTFAGVEGTLIVSLCPRQSVRLAKGVIYRVSAGRDGVAQVSTAKAFRRVPESASKKPQACLSTGLVWNAGATELRGKAHLAVMKPFKPATLALLVARWKRQDFHDAAAQARSAARANGGGGAGAEDDHLSADHMGLSTPALLKRMQQAVADGKLGRYLPEGTKIGLSLSSSESSVRGTVLRK